jgi:hypothetical protein
MPIPSELISNSISHHDARNIHAGNSAELRYRTCRLLPFNAQLNPMPGRAPLLLRCAV